MERYKGIKHTIEELEKQESSSLQAALLRELYLTEGKFTTAYFDGEVDVRRFTHAVRIMYMHRDEERTVTIHLEADLQANRDRLREIFNKFPGHPGFIQLLSGHATELIRQEGLRILSAAEISNAEDDDRPLFALHYPKVFQQKFGNEISTGFAMSLIQAVPVPDVDDMPQGPIS